MIGCITCSDQGIPMRVVSYSPLDGTAWCVGIQTLDLEKDCECQEVLSGVVGPLAVGDILLVHAGTALLKLPHIEPPHVPDTP